MWAWLTDVPFPEEPPTNGSRRIAQQKIPITEPPGHMLSPKRVQGDRTTHSGTEWDPASSPTIGTEWVSG